MKPKMTISAAGAATVLLPATTLASLDPSMLAAIVLESLSTSHLDSIGLPYTAANKEGSPILISLTSEIREQGKTWESNFAENTGRMPSDEIIRAIDSYVADGKKCDIIISRNSVITGSYASQIPDTDDDDPEFMTTRMVLIPNGPGEYITLASDSTRPDHWSLQNLEDYM